MESLFIKLGKVYKAIRKNGFLKGIKITLVYLRTYFRNIFSVESGDILIITDGVGDSAYYRSHNQAEEFNLHGLKCSTTVSDNPFLLGLSDKFKIFIFHRTFYSVKIQKLVEKIKLEGKSIIFDTDDLVYNALYFHETDFYKNLNALEKKQYEKAIGEEIINDPYVKVCSAPTSYLAQKIQAHGKKVFISSNKISAEEQEKAEEVVLNERRNGERIIIGYFSGSYGHNRDFATISDSLIEILIKYSQVDLLLVGYIDLSEKFKEFEARIEKIPFVPRNQFWEYARKTDIYLAPLVLGDPFCEAKSELKFFEAGILKIPTVAVRNQTFSEAITDGEDGFLAAGKEEWREKISTLIEDENLRKRMGEKALEKVLRDYTVKNSHNEEYYAFLRKLIQ